MTALRYRLLALVLVCAGCGTPVHTFSIGGALSGNTDDIVLALNGNDLIAVPPGQSSFSFVKKLPAGAAYRVSVATAPADQQCEVSQGEGVATAEISSVVVTCTGGQINSRGTGGPPADFVIGEPSLTTPTYVVNYRGLGIGKSEDPNGLFRPVGNPAVAGEVLYISDSQNNRVLGYLHMPTGDGASPDFVLGQPDFVSVDYGFSPSGMIFPTSAASYQGKLLIVDSGNNRILVYNDAPTTTGASASYAIGQSDLYSRQTGCSGTQLNGPNSLQVGVGGQLIVADTLNFRVLIWNTIPLDPNTPADLVLGQPDITTCDQPDISRPTGASLNIPQDAWTDGHKVLVADHASNGGAGLGLGRILGWNSFPTANNTPADFAIGAPSVTSSHAECFQQYSLSYEVCSTNAVVSDGNRIFVASRTTGDPRVAIFNHWPTASMPTVDGALGHSLQRGGNPAQPDATNMFIPSGLLLLPDKLLVVDAGFCRVTAHSLK